MGKLVATVASYFACILFLLARNVESRHLQYNATELVSDGIVQSEESIPSILLPKGILHSSGEQHCRQMYGFLPCSSNLAGHFFLIVIYEYLLYHGEAYASGDGRIFHVFGNNFAVSSFSQLLDSVPESLILLGNFNSLFMLFIFISINSVWII